MFGNLTTSWCFGYLIGLLWMAVPHRTWSQNQRGWRHYSKELFLDADRHLASLGLHALRSRVVEPLLQVLDPPRRWNVAEPFNNWRRKKTAPTYCISFASTPCTPWLSLEFRTPHTCCLLRAPPEAPTFHVRVFNQPRMQWAPQDFFLPLWSFCIHSKDISPQG